MMDFFRALTFELKGKTSKKLPKYCMPQIWKTEFDYFSKIKLKNIDQKHSMSIFFFWLYSWASYSAIFFKRSSIIFILGQKDIKFVR